MKVMQTIFSLILLLSGTSATAQWWNPPTPQPVGKINIRGFVYNDHSANTTVAPTAVRPGQFIEIVSRSLVFENMSGNNYDLRVILQDANRPPNSFGVTVYRLTNVTARGMTIDARIPFLSWMRGRTFHVTVFMIGQQPWHYAHAGQITIQ